MPSFINKEKTKKKEKVIESSVCGLFLTHQPFQWKTKQKKNSSFPITNLTPFSPLYLFICLRTFLSRHFFTLLQIDISTSAVININLFIICYAVQYYIIRIQLAPLQ